MGFPCFVNKGTVKIDTKPYGALTPVVAVHIVLHKNRQNRYKALRGINTRMGAFGSSPLARSKSIQSPTGH